MVAVVVVGEAASSLHHCTTASQVVGCLYPSRRLPQLLHHFLIAFNSQYCLLVAKQNSEWVHTSDC